MRAVADVCSGQPDETRLEKLFGAGAAELTWSGDVDDDREAGLRVVELMKTKLSFVATSPGLVFAELRNDNWRFPIPLVKTPEGWRFDLEEGKDELLTRRSEPARRARRRRWEGRRRLQSGRRVASVQRLPLPDPHEAGAHAPGGRKSYVDQMGLMTKGFAAIAWPAEYGRSGMMTFLVSEAGVVFQKDLGPETGNLTRSIAEYDPDRSWSPVRRPAELRGR